MAQEAFTGSYPPLTRHPELQRVRQAQMQSLIDPGFLQALMGGGQPTMTSSAGMGQPQKPMTSKPPFMGGAGGFDEMQSWRGQVRGGQFSPRGNDGKL